MEWNRTALLDGSSAGHSDCVRALLAAGADIRVQDKDGSTALKWAMLFGQVEVVEILQEHERFLAQLGSHTKPALREPVSLVSGESSFGFREKGLLYSFAVIFPPLIAEVRYLICCFLFVCFSEGRGSRGAT
eukprot:m.122253 g.122253  ORF g.122253 m.122253 type:complete len:132 (-) comp52115_c0_seq3:42-437(-)